MKRILLTLTPFSRFFFVSSSKKLQATLVIKRIVPVPIRKLFLPCGFNHSGNYEDIFFSSLNKKRWLNLKKFLTLAPLSQNMCQITILELYPSKEKMFRIVFCTNQRLEPTWKTFWYWATFTQLHFYDVCIQFFFSWVEKNDIL